MIMGGAVKRAKTFREEPDMGKIIDCNKVNPASGCTHVVRGDTEEELMQKASEHAKSHGLEPTAELLEMVKSQIEDEKIA